MEFLENTGTLPNKGNNGITLLGIPPTSTAWRKSTVSCSWRMHWIGCTAHLTQYFIVRDIEYFMKNKNIFKNITRLLLIYKTNSSITVLNEPNIRIFMI